ncbi:DUF4349 domain-containing protein [Streptomyces sp. MUM 203J]|uniref:DUF4349 domain-containing protein n=1 Tax=Streptomyces sp. MUM 203J TaxID=2791990 RepID=UPI001F04F153|nr:DUF4349 domain-containing protein [Streptomyces sp. MUM 203J]MCH0538979.1 DUF4349 domain-containing protein [Streptomyces sp. MUM 203J]
MPSSSRPRSLHVLAAVLLGSSLALAGCSGEGGGTESTADRAAARPAEGNPGAAPGYDGSGASSAGEQKEESAARDAKGKPAVPQQHVIRTAELHVEVKDADRALARARTVTENAGGHVANESTTRRGERGLSSRIVLRVPQQEYEAVLEELSGAGKLRSRKADAKDVTDQVVDVQSRIATQRASVARVRELMDKAERLSDVVTLEGELSRRQSDLEALLAQQASLKDRTSMATVTLELTEPDPAEKDTDEDGAPGVLDALRGGWGALVAAGTWLVIVLAALAPWLAVLAAGYAVWRLVVRPLRRRGRVAARTEQPGSPAAEAALPPFPGPAAAEPGASEADRG